MDQAQIPAHLSGKFWSGWFPFWIMSADAVGVCCFCCCCCCSTRRSRMLNCLPVVAHINCGVFSATVDQGGGSLWRAMWISSFFMPCIPLIVCLLFQRMHKNSYRHGMFSVLCCCLHLSQVSAACFKLCKLSFCMVSMLVCVGTSVCVCVCVCARACALRIVSMNKILCLQILYLLTTLSIKSRNAELIYNAHLQLESHQCVRQ